MDIVFVHGKFQEHKVDLNAFNQSLIINALNNGDAESNLRFWVSLVRFYCLEITAYLSYKKVEDKSFY